MTCVFCNNDKTERFTLAKKGSECAYYRCRECGGVYMEESSRFCASDQKKRYELHQNTLTDSGYTAFLRGFTDSVFAFLTEKGVGVKTLFDYGSGPAPCLVTLLQDDARCGTYAPLSIDAEVRGWDPFFAPDTPFFTGGADLVTCLEVAEHFENPALDFLRLASSCKKGGYVAIGTLFLRDGTDFALWWYKDDRTHVSFYTERAITAVASRAGLMPVLIEPRLCILQKE